MNYILNLSCVLLLFASFASINAQYEDRRCICVCPQPPGANASKSVGMVFNYPVPPEKCNCEDAVLPNLFVDMKGHENEFCPRCDCKYESRNTTIIKVVVMLMTWVLSMLILYMIFLQCLEPLLNKKRAQYQHQTNEEELSEQPVEAPQEMQRPQNVLGRVGHEQNKWKRQVMEQRRNIYDRHAMLN